MSSDPRLVLLTHLLLQLYGTHGSPPFFSKTSGQMHSAKGNVKEGVRINYLSFLPRSEDDVTLFYSWALWPALKTLNPQASRSTSKARANMTLLAPRAMPKAPETVLVARRIRSSAQWQETTLSKLKVCHGSSCLSDWDDWRRYVGDARQSKGSAQQDINRNI